MQCCVANGQYQHTGSAAKSQEQLALRWKMGRPGRGLAAPVFCTANAKQPPHGKVQWLL